MPRPEPSAITGTADINTMIEHVAPAILALLAGRHVADDVALALVRLAVTGQMVESGSKYTRWRRSRRRT